MQPTARCAARTRSKCSRARTASRAARRGRRASSTSRTTRRACATRSRRSGARARPTTRRARSRRATSGCGATSARSTTRPSGCSTCSRSRPRATTGDAARPPLDLRALDAARAAALLAERLGADDAAAAREDAAEIVALGAALRRERLELPFALARELRDALAAADGGGAADRPVAARGGAATAAAADDDDDDDGDGDDGDDAGPATARALGLVVSGMRRQAHSIDLDRCAGLSILAARSRPTRLALSAAAVASARGAAPRSRASARRRRSATRSTPRCGGARAAARAAGARARAEALARDATVEVDASATLATLRQLAALGLGASELRATGVGKLVGALRKHPHAGRRGRRGDARGAVEGAGRGRRRRRRRLAFGRGTRATREDAVAAKRRRGRAAAAPRRGARTTATAARRAAAIERALFRRGSAVAGGYAAAARQLCADLGRDDELRARVASRAIAPEELVAMSANERAPPAVRAEQRRREALLAATAEANVKSQIVGSKRQACPSCGGWECTVQDRPRPRRGTGAASSYLDIDCCAASAGQWKSEEED